MASGEEDDLMKRGELQLRERAYLSWNSWIATENRARGRSRWKEDVAALMCHVGQREQSVRVSQSVSQPASQPISQSVSHSLSHSFRQTVSCQSVSSQSVILFCM